ncbi:MAG: GTP pyrophosphokinase family protein [bacterium]
MEKTLIDKHVLEKDFFKKINQNIMPFKIMMTKYHCALMQVDTKFKVLDEEFSLKYNYNPIESIKTRLKTPESIFEKVNNKNISLSSLSIGDLEENIKDIAGVRIICSFIEDIYTLRDCLSKQDDVIIISEKDYIKNPKSNGYRSLHLIIEVPVFFQDQKIYVKVEVQFRTIAMDFWASLEHKVKYKKDVPKELENSFQLELLECAEVSHLLDMKMEKIKNRLFHPK